MVIAVKAHKIAYMALPKAGCSSVKEALARADPDVTLPPRAEQDVHLWHAIYPTRRFRPHRWKKLADHWRFCVVRDPVRRLMSCYTNRVLQFEDLKNSRKIREGRDHLPDLPTDPDPDFFFQNLEAYKSASSSIKHHALGAWLFLGQSLKGQYDHVYRTGELAQLAQDLSLRTGVDLSMPRGNPSEDTLRLDDLKGETIDALRPFLEQEYAYLFGYYRNPLGPRIHDACALPIRRVS